MGDPFEEGAGDPASRERSIWVVYVASRFVPLRISEVARQLVAALREREPAPRALHPGRQ
jgi:hypothetical protein